MAARTLLTFEQFEQHQDDGMKHELLRGEHLITAPATIRQSLIRHNVHDALWPYVREHQLGEVYISAGFRISSNVSVAWLIRFYPTLSTSKASNLLARLEPNARNGAPRRPLGSRWHPR